MAAKLRYVKSVSFSGHCDPFLNPPPLSGFSFGEFTMITTDRCTYSHAHRTITRWTEPVRCPKSDAQWDALVEREDDEEAEAFAAQAAHKAALV